jgi:TPR repeat protein
VGKDQQEAVKWYKKAAEQGDAGAQYNLAWCYRDGAGVKKDEKEAVKWYTKAAEQNYEEAKKALERIKAKQ